MNQRSLRCALAAGLMLGPALGNPARPAAQGAGTPPQQPAAPPASSTSTQAPQTPEATFRGGINFVRVDVIVSDRQGRPVGDLRQQDFEITEDGKPQTIQAFRFINVVPGTTAGPMPPPGSINSPTDEEREAARDDARLFAVFLDDYHVTQSAGMRAREPLAQFVENQLQDLDLITTMYPLTPLEDVRVTRNRKNVASAIRQFDGRKGDYRPRNSLENRYVHLPVADVEQIRNQVSMSALKGLITHLGGLRDGRKALILLSEGFTNLLPPERQSTIATIPGLGAPPPQIGPRSPQQQSQELFADSEMQMDLREISTLANQYNTSIYTVDPRGLAVFEYDLSGPAVGFENDRAVLGSTLTSLRNLADDTDGRAIVNQNDLAGGLRQIVSDSSAYYLIGYSSIQAPADGKFHEIKVRVTRPNMTVRSRKGYWALTADEKARAEAPAPKGPPAAIESALSMLEGPDRRRLIRSWVGMAPGANGKTRISFVWEPIPLPPGARGETAARVSIVAGGGADLYFRGKTPATIPPGASPGAPAVSAPGPLRIAFDVPPGPLDLQLAIEDSGAQVIDRETRRITVPDLSGSGVTMSTPEVFRARTVREWQLLAADVNAVPLPEREFRRTDRLLIRVAAKSDAATPVVSARLLNRMGQEMSLALAVSPATTAGVVNVDAPLASIPIGDYLIELKAAANGEESSSLVAFRITG